MLPYVEPAARIAIDLSAVGLTDEMFSRICRDKSELGLELTEKYLHFSRETHSALPPSGASPLRKEIPDGLD